MTDDFGGIRALAEIAAGDERALSALVKSALEQLRSDEAAIVNAHTASSIQVAVHQATTTSELLAYPALTLSLSVFYEHRNSASANLREARAEVLRHLRKLMRHLDEASLS